MTLLQLLGNDRWTLKELMSLKVYTDTTELCKLFRLVHWKSDTNKQKKREFFWWALIIFQTMQYHKKPLNYLSKENPNPIGLFHGLSQQYIVRHVCPFYNGPSSTTSAQNIG